MADGSLLSWVWNPWRIVMASMLAGDIDEDEMRERLLELDADLRRDVHTLVVLSRSIHTGSGMVSYEPKMAKFLRKDARMTTVVAPSLAISPRVQLTARQRACLEQIARRQTSPQRLVARGNIH